MRKIEVDGGKIKELRDARDRGATQKEFAHEIGVSERRLRAIENRNAPVTVELAGRIARSLGVPMQALAQAREVEPPTPPPTAEAPADAAAKPTRRQEIIPRFEDTIAHFVGDEAGLVELVRGNWVVLSHVMTPLSAETSIYAEELISILRTLAWDPRVEERKALDGAEEIAVRSRIRDLLVLLKGNDVWVYGDSNMKALPESHALPPQSARRDYELQAIIAFGPPGEWGETAIRVPVDRGQPHMMTW